MYLGHETPEPTSPPLLCLVLYFFLSSFLAVCFRNGSSSSSVRTSCCLLVIDTSSPVCLRAAPATMVFESFLAAVPVLLVFSLRLFSSLFFSLFLSLAFSSGDTKQTILPAGRYTYILYVYDDNNSRGAEKKKKKKSPATCLFFLMAYSRNSLSFLLSIYRVWH